MLKKFDAKKFTAEAVGTFVLVLFGCGTAVYTGDLVAIALAFGLVIVALAYVIGPISGCHINPAVTLGCAVNKRVSWLEAAWYWIAQVLGGIAGAGVLYALVKLSGHDKVTNLGQNFYSETDYGLNMWGALIAEVVLTFVFVLTVLMTTSKEKGAGKKAGVIIGLALTLVHLFGIRLTGTSVNPARSFGPALFMLDTAIKQVWAFIVAPLAGAVGAAFFAKFVLGSESEKAAHTDEIPLN